MKHIDVKAGMVVETKVGEEWVRVKVVAPRYRISPGERDRWRVVRVDNERELPKARTAAAFRPVRP